jgi:hypothetical protein
MVLDAAEPERGDIPPANSNGQVASSIAAAGDDELERLIADVVELQSRRDSLSQEIETLIHAVRDKS